MTERETILQEMVTIYKKYLTVAEQIGTIGMSAADRERLAELEAKLEVL